MRLRLHNEFRLVHELAYFSAARGGGLEHKRLPILQAHADGIPEELSGLVLTSDLQGVASSALAPGETQLLGVSLVDELLEWGVQGMLPELHNCGVILAGDLYSAPGANKRGATGDVREVWEAFSSVSRWVAGVAGNHDSFGSESDKKQLQRLTNLSLLDGETVLRNGLRIGGVSKIIGNPDKAGRRGESDFLRALRKVESQSPDLLVMHEGPDGHKEQRGNSVLREQLAKTTALIVCGHVHWDEALFQEGSFQVVNVDARVVVLTPPRNERVSAPVPAGP